MFALRMTLEHPVRDEFAPFATETTGNLKCPTKGSRASSLEALLEKDTVT